jgi:monoamine oxidase
VQADRVVLAIPFSVLRRLDYAHAGFEPTKQAAIEQLGYGTNAKLHLQFDDRMWNESGPWGMSNGSSTIGASFTGDRTNPRVVDSYAKKFLDQIEPVFPGMTPRWNHRATLDTPASNPFLRGSYSYWRVGQYTLFAGVEKEPSGHCYFAGEHCSVDFQGFMEGAAVEGARAADEILRSV